MLSISRTSVALAFVRAFVLALGLFIAGCSDEQDPVTPQSPHFQPDGLVVLNDDRDTVVYYFQGVLRPGDTLAAPPGNNLSEHWTIEFLGSTRQKIDYPPAEQTLGWTIADQSIAEVYRHPGEEWEFHLRGKLVGMTTIVLKVLHEGHSDFTTRPIPVKVDASVHGEAAGMVIIAEESGDTLVNVRPPGSTVAGSLTVTKDSTTDHSVVYFYDDAGRPFQPGVPPHSLGFTVINPAVAEIIPAGPDEPWAFQVKGLAVGSTEVVFKLLVEATPEWSTPSIRIDVTP
jgi:hypothetical protein